MTSLSPPQGQIYPKFGFNHKSNPLETSALAYAAKGYPVFPLRPGRKEPFPGSGGFHDATTDLSQIRQWWTENPQANIGIPTGERSGLLVLDVDPDDGGYESLAKLVETGEGLPLTTVIQTGGDGRHHYYRCPEYRVIRNSVGKLGPGLDIRGEGGYVVAPPSRTVGPYKVLHKRPLSDPPKWLTETLREPSSPPSQGNDKRRGANRTHATNVELDGPPIRKKTRNGTLTSIAGLLHDGTRTPGQLEGDLLKLNSARCQPPLPASEVKKIAGSISKKGPCKPATKTTPQTVAALDAIEEEMWQSPERWRGKAGLSRWKIKYALVDAAREHGILIAGGVRIGLSYRNLAELAGVSLSTVQKNLPEMKRQGEVRADNLGRREEEAGVFVLSVPDSANSAHSPTTTELLRTTEWTSVPSLRILKKLRHGAPRVWRLGPRSGMAVLALLRSGGVLSYEELASKLGVSRTRDLCRKGGVIERMRSAGMIECSDTEISLTSGWLETLEEARTTGREEEAEQLKKLQHLVERTKYAYRLHRGKETHRPHVEAVHEYHAMRERLRR